MMTDVFAFVKDNFIKVIYFMDNAYIFGEFSVLDFNITLLIFGAILPIVLITVNNWTNGSIQGQDTRDSLKRQREYNRAAAQRHKDFMDSLKERK